MHTDADGLHQLFEHLDLKDAMMVGHSTGGGEVARFVGRYGTSRVSKAVLVSVVTPLMVKTDKNPGGLPVEVFDGFRAAMIKDRAQFFHDVPTGPFFGFNRENAKAFSETDFTEDLKRMDIPVPILHDDDDQVVPVGASAHNPTKLVPKATLKTFPGAPHALPNTHVDQVNQELFAFLAN